MPYHYIQQYYPDPGSWRIVAATLAAVLLCATAYFGLVANLDYDRHSHCVDQPRCTELARSPASAPHVVVSEFYE